MIVLIGFIANLMMIFGWQTTIIKEQPGEHLGCFLDSEEETLFTISPGDYLPNDLSPITCMLSCGKRWQIAGIQNGNLCLCSKSRPAKFENDINCSANCTGIHSPDNFPQCGGVQHVSVYDISQRITGLTIESIKHVNLYDMTVLKTDLMNGKNVEYIFDTGNGFIGNTRESSIEHIYDRPGRFEVTIMAQNNISGIHTATMNVGISDPVTHASMECDKIQTFGLPIECRGSIKRGLSEGILFDFGDSSTEVLHPHNAYSIIGNRNYGENQEQVSIINTPGDTVILPNAEFQRDSVVYGWEIETMATGRMLLQIFRPKCEGGNFCKHKHTCKTKTNKEVEHCNDGYDTPVCSSEKIFCFQSQRCINNDKFASSSCSDNAEDKFVGVIDEFVLVHQTEYTAQSIGRVFIKEEPPLHVKEGSLLGWTSQGGAISYSKVEGHDSSEFIFLKSGSELKKKNPNNTIATKHSLSVSVIEESKFFLRHVYNESGQYTIISNVTERIDVSVDIPIESITIQCPATVFTFTDISVNISEHAGSNVLYTFILDKEGRNFTTTKRDGEKFSYENHGLHTVMVKASNPVSQKSDKCVISVLHDIKGLEFTEVAKAVALNKTFTAYWKVDSGTNITYKVNLGDGAIKEIYQESELHGSITHVYGKAGTYTITVTATNELRTSPSIQTSVNVEIAIYSVKIKTKRKSINDYIYVGLNQKFPMEVNVEGGTNVACSFSFNDSTQSSKRSPERFYTKRFTTAGVFKAWVTCNNHISTLVDELPNPIIAEKLKEITGLNIDVLEGKVFGEDASIKGTMAEGSVFICKWDLGDGSSVKAIDKMTFSMAIRHRYNQVGSYNITLTCQNGLGTAKVTKEITVDTPISGVGINCPENKFIAVDEEINFYVDVYNGTNIEAGITFGDGVNQTLNQLESSNNSLKVGHTYLNPGTFTVTLFARNQHGLVNKSCEDIITEYKVENVTVIADSRIKLNPGVATFRYSLQDNTPLPTNAQFEISFGDDSLDVKASFETMEKNGILAAHQYKLAGSYKTITRIYNDVSSQYYMSNIEVLEVKQIKISVFQLNPSTNEILRGKETNGQAYFSFGSTIYVNVTTQTNDLAYTFNFGDETHVSNQEQNHAKHMYEAIGVYSIKADVENILEELIASKTICIQEAIKDMSAHVGARASYGKEFLLEIKAMHYGNNICVRVDFGDTSTYIFNRRYCDINSTLQSGLVYKNLTKDRPIRVIHYYTSKDLHNISVSVYNQVSRFETTKEIFVDHKLCPKFAARIQGGGTEETPLSYMRNRDLTLHINFDFTCNFAENVTFTWQVFAANDSIPLQLPTGNSGVAKASLPITRKQGEPNPQLITIPSNLLPFGKVRIELTVEYESGLVDLSGIKTTNSTWLKITPSNLKAVIQGGVGKAIGFEIPVVFDASKTYDPDLLESSSNHSNHGNGSIVYRWFCRRWEESFNEDYTLKDPEDRKAGCFRNGRFQLDGSYGGYMEVSDDASIISIDSNLTQHAKYVMRVYVSKGTRSGLFDQEITVLPGEPPILKVSCSLNCFEKINPEQPLKIQSTCLNCNSATNIFYRWRLYEKQNGGLLANGGKPGLEIKNLQEKTSTTVTNKNIALRSNVLQTGVEYVLQLRAWKEGANESQAGFGDFMFTVNDIPRDGSCVLLPKNGVALVDQFIVKCADWYDTDSPITYSIDSLRRGVVQNLYTGPKSENAMYLPLGEVDNNYIYRLIVTVYDKFHFGKKVKLDVRVTAPTTVDYNKVNSKLQNMIDGAELQELARYALSAGSVLNRKVNNHENPNGASTYEDKEDSKARDAMLKSISKITPCSLSGIKQIGGVHMEITKTGISEESQKRSGDALAEMSRCMANAPSSDPDMESTADTMFNASSNILKAGLSRQKDVTKGTGKSPTDKVIDTFNNIGGALMRQMVAGDETRTVKLTGDSMEMEMSQVTDDADEETTGFKLPNLEALFGNQTRDSSAYNHEKQSSVGAMLIKMDKNPYAKVGGSENIKSIVQGLSLSGPDGKPLDLAGQTLTMFVKRDVSGDMIPSVYNSTNRKHVMTFHRFNFTSEENVMAIEMRPVGKFVSSRILIKYQVKPSFDVLNGTYIYEQPSKYNVTKQNKTKSPDPFIHIVSAKQLNGTGQYYIGIHLIQSESTTSSSEDIKYLLRMWEVACKLWDEEEKIYSTEGCTVGPKTTFNATHCICNIGCCPAFQDVDIEAANNTALNSTKTQAYKQLHRRSKIKLTRATFASSFFVAPNPIDFSATFSGNLDENYLVFTVILVIFGIYLFLLVWARREDRKDITRAGVTALEENQSSDQQFYEITVCTGFGINAGTSANVYIQLSGDEDQTEVRQLKDSNRKLFQARRENVFLASYEKCIGDLQHVRIWHDNAGKNPSWNLTRIIVNDLNEDRKYLFINDVMIAVEQGDGSLERVIPVAGPVEMKSFNHLFYSSTQKNITDKHIWFSIFIRPPKSRFTRVQRLSCCLTLLYMTMLASMMFYEVGDAETNASFAYHLGPFAFSPGQIGIGMMTTLVIFPINLLIVGFFRNIGPKPSKEEIAKKKSRRFWVWHEFKELFVCCISKPNKNFIDIIERPEDGRSSKQSTITNETMFRSTSSLDGTEIGFKMETTEQQEERKKKEKRRLKQKNKLPYWMLYVAWCLLILTTLTASFFVYAYGMTFGEEKSAQWFSAFFLSFIQDVFIAQPGKVLALALFIALIVKKPEEDEEGELKNITNNKSDQEIVESSLKKEECDDRGMPKKREIIRFQPPSKERVSALRNYRLKEIKMYNFLRELFLYLLFVVALCQVSYSHMDPSSFQLRRSSLDILIENEDNMFHEINSISQVWRWLDEVVVEGLFKDKTYNGESIKRLGFTDDFYSNTFGGARLRQVRVKRNSCKVHKMFVTEVPKCHGEYSWLDEDENNYDPGWKTIANHSLTPLFFKSWEYQTSAELNTYPFVGKHGAYRGGGYTGHLVQDKQRSRELLKFLEANRWLDVRSRALFVEVTTYNAQVNLFTAMNLIVELLPTGGVETFSSLRIARLYTYGGEKTEGFTIACQFFVIIFMAMFIYKEGKKIYGQRKAYFKGFWNMIEFTLIILIMTSVIIFMSRIVLVDLAMKSIHDNPGQFVSFNKVVQWDTLFSAVSSIVVFLTCIKFLKLLRYSQTISIFASTLKGSATPLAGFSVIFIVFFFAFTIPAYLMFMPQDEQFSSFVATVETVMSFLLGDFDIESVVSVKPIYGRAWFSLLMLFGSMYIMNVFLAIVMQTYKNVRADIRLQSQEYEIVDFMVNKFKSIIGKGDGGKKALLQDIAAKEKQRETEKVAAQRHEGKVGKEISFVHRTRKRYFQTLDDEIERKFAQLDDSLDGFWMDICDKEKSNASLDYGCGLHGGTQSTSPRLSDKFHYQAYENPCFDLQEDQAELLMKRDLAEELSRWS